MTTIEIKVAANSLRKKVDELEGVVEALKKENDYHRKVKVLNALPIVQDYISRPGPIQEFMKQLSIESEFAIKSIIAIGQAPIVFNIERLNETLYQHLIVLLEHLLELDLFYNYLGGIIGYHLTVLKLIIEHYNPTPHNFTHNDYTHPEGLNINVDTSEVRQAVRWGIQHMPEIAMIWPLGGAGDRLNLKDEKTNNPLPAALLPFLGFTLLEGMMRDLQAQEYLYYKLFKKQIDTPIAIMTSVEKDNHVHILDICKTHNWFGKSSSSFHFFIQPLVPVITVEGNWSLSAPLMLTLKPCGHGVLWKLAEEQGVFKWLEKHRRQHSLIRQINNPLAATDQALFALIGIGCQKHKSFGFLSCERLLKSEEGTNVLIEDHSHKGYDYCLTNIEYTQFPEKGIEEIPVKPGSPYSTFPTNTNILFVDIPSIRNLLKTCPIPGLTINMKSEVPYIDSKGNSLPIAGGRLESTMQNIADHLIDYFPQKLSKRELQDKLSTFILYNQRSKTISTTKKSYKEGNNPYSTPEQAFYDLLSNHHILLKQCQFTMPSWSEIEDYLKNGPDFIFLFHPGLGPIYSIIAQKIRKGNLKKGAELQLEIAEVNIENLSLDGSLLIIAHHPLGRCHNSGLLEYGNEGRCMLKNVSVVNQGIDRSHTHHYWKNTPVRKEAVEIIIHEGGEFEAENVMLEGSHRFEVPPHHRLTLSNEKGEIKKQLIPIDQSTWKWEYSFDSSHFIKLVLKR